MTRSRLRRPMSKSITTTVWPVRASAVPKAAVDVVLPTPPFPDVTTTTLPISVTLLFQSSATTRYRVAFEPSLDRPAAKVHFDIVGSLVQAVDGEAELRSRRAPYDRSAKSTVAIPARVSDSHLLGPPVEEIPPPYPANRLHCQHPNGPLRTHQA